MLANELGARFGSVFLSMNVWPSPAKNITNNRGKSMELRQPTGMTDIFWFG